MSAALASSSSLFSPLGAFLVANTDPDYAEFAKEAIDAHRRDPPLALQMLHSMRVACELGSWDAMIERTRLENPELAALMFPVSA